MAATKQLKLATRPDKTGRVAILNHLWRKKIQNKKLFGSRKKKKKKIQFQFLGKGFLNESKILFQFSLNISNFLSFFFRRNFFDFDENGTNILTQA